MRGEILAIGDELTSGRVQNTTSCLAARFLFAAGHEIVAMTTVGDVPSLIGTALHTALGRAQFILVTGGLGATSDDLTNEAVAAALGRPTTLNHEVRNSLVRNGSSLDQADQRMNGLAKLAWLPAGAKAMKPGSGMAGHLLVHAGVVIFFLPGVPHEMEELLVDCVLPELHRLEPSRNIEIQQRLFKVFGLPETEINRRLAHLENASPGLAIGYYPVYPEVHVSLTLRGATADQLASADQAAREALGSFLYGTDADSLATVVGDLLRQQGLTLAVAESCTGGRISAELTAAAGSSDFFLGGVVTYSNSLKEAWLGVPDAVLADQGAVSMATATAMATGMRTRSGADLTVAVTGIAGPGGGTNAKPVGTVCFGLAAATQNLSLTKHFQGERWQIQAMATGQALDLLRRHLLGLALHDD
jgi:nicotinamide-nucleotide amidase